MPWGSSIIIVDMRISTRMWAEWWWQVPAFKAIIGDEDSHATLLPLFVQSGTRSSARTTRTRALPGSTPAPAPAHVLVLVHLPTHDETARDNTTVCSTRPRSAQGQGQRGVMHCALFCEA